MPATAPQHRRPHIDLDLGRACQYGYRTYTVEVVHHAAAPPTYDLRAARQRAGISLVTIAGLLGTTHTSAYRWEHGHSPCPEVMRSRWRQECERRISRAAR